MKATINGAIAPLGTRYVVSLAAVSCEEGDTIARAQSEAESKEEVLRTLGQVAVDLRQRLGESLASIKAYDAPIEQATTRSLEALRAFGLGQAARDRAEERVAVPLLKQAAEIDPNFAMAHARLGAAYANMGQRPDARAALIRAYELRGRASEIERFYIEARHAEVVLNDDLKAVDVYSAWQQRYPNDFTTYNNLAGIFLRLSRDDEALAQAQQAVRMNPDVAFPYANLSEVFIRLARYDEARQVVEAALERGFKYPDDLVRIGVAQGDRALIEKGLSLMGEGRQVEAARLAHLELEAAGRFRSAAAAREEVLAAQRATGAGGDAAEGLAGAMVLAIVGSPEARLLVAAAITRPTLPPNQRANASTVLAILGDAAEARRQLDLALAGALPNARETDLIWPARTEAHMALAAGKPDLALTLLRKAQLYRRARPPFLYISGMANLQSGRAADAQAEWARMRQISAGGFWDVMATLGMARSAAMLGDTASAKREYQDFLAAWKDADADVPLLIEAKAEYAKLNTP